jgi:hypothetical protein
LFDDDVCDREREAGASSADEVAGQPVGAVLGVRGDQQLIGLEAHEGVGDRPHRVGVADAPFDTHAGVVERVNTRRQPYTCLTARAVLIRGPVANAGVQRRCDDTHLDVALRYEQVVQFVIGIVSLATIRTLRVAGFDVTAQRPFVVAPTSCLAC